MAFIKNPQKRIVSVTDEHKKYLLDPEPIALDRRGQPKLTENGETIAVVKSFHETGWTDVTPEEEEAARESELAPAQEKDTAGVAKRGRPAKTEKKDEKEEDEKEKGGKDSK